MNTLKKTETINGKEFHIFEITKECKEEVLYTSEELAARKTKLEDRIAVAEAKTLKDRTELERINDLINLL